MQVLEKQDVLGQSAFPLATDVHFKILKQELAGLLPTTWPNSNKQQVSQHRRLNKNKNATKATTTRSSAVSHMSRLRADLLNDYDPQTAPIVYHADGTIAPVNVSVGLRFYAIHQVHGATFCAREEDKRLFCVLHMFLPHELPPPVSLFLLLLLYCRPV